MQIVRKQCKVKRITVLTNIPSNHINSSPPQFFVSWELMIANPCYAFRSIIFAQRNTIVVFVHHRTFTVYHA